MVKLFYKGKEISSEDAHKLDPKEKVYLTARKPSLEEIKTTDKKEKRRIKNNGKRRPN